MRFLGSRADVEGTRGLRGLAAVPVSGGGAWPGFEPTRRAKLTARMAEARGADTTAS